MVDGGKNWLVVVSLVAGCFAEPEIVEDDGVAEGESGAVESGDADVGSGGSDDDSPDAEDGSDDDVPPADDADGTDDGGETGGETGDETGDGSDSSGDPLVCGECPIDESDPCLVPACVAGQCVLEDHGVVVYRFGDGLPEPARQAYGLDPEVVPGTGLGAPQPMFRILDAEVAGAQAVHQVHQPTVLDWFLTFDPDEGVDIGYEPLGTELGYAWPHDATPPPGAVTVHRHYRMDTGTHLHAMGLEIEGTGVYVYEGPSVIACPLLSED